MNNNDPTLKILVSCFALVLLSMLLCSVGFGLGFAVNHVLQNNPVEARAITRPVVPDNTADSETSNPNVSIASVDNFDVFWEAMDYLRENFDGDVPTGNELTFAAAEGIMNNVGSCDEDEQPSQIIQIAEPRQPDEAPANFAFFWDTVNRVYADCPAQSPEPDQLVYVAVNGVIDQLQDDYTNILPPDHAEDFRIDLESTFEGIGATVEPTDEEAGTGVRIVYPFPGSPAEKSGLLQNDEVLAVDGVDVTEMDLDEAVQLIRGPAGTVVKLTIARRSDSTFDVEITRDRIDIPIIDWQITDDNLLYIALYDFSSRTVDEMRTALETGVDAGVDGIILDLRGNPGGFLDASISIASMFIEDGVIVSETGHRNIDHEAEGDAIVPDLPLVVLVDAGSASASEIVAGAVQDYGRGVLIGEQTFGKGSVQTIFDLSDGSILRVTTARWYTPMGRQIDSSGLTPDIQIPFGSDPNADPQLDAAVKYLLKQEQAP